MPYIFSSNNNMCSYSLKKKNSFQGHAFSFQPALSLNKKKLFFYEIIIWKLGCDKCIGAFFLEFNEE